MSRRTIIIDSLIAHIAETVGVAGFRGMKFLEEINSFPAFYVHPDSESRIHKGGGVVYGILSLAIRGYQWTDNLDDVDLLGRQLETGIQSFVRANRDMIEDARVLSIGTDEGMMEPYGVVDISAQVIYYATDGINQPTKIINYTAQDSSGNILQIPDGKTLVIPLEFN